MPMRNARAQNALSQRGQIRLRCFSLAAPIERKGPRFPRGLWLLPLLRLAFLLGGLASVGDFDFLDFRPEFAVLADG